MYPTLSLEKSTTCTYVVALMPTTWLIPDVAGVHFTVYIHVPMHVDGAHDRCTVETVTVFMTRLVTMGGSPSVRGGG